MKSSKRRILLNYKNNAKILFSFKEIKGGLFFFPEPLDNRSAPILKSEIYKEAKGLNTRYNWKEAKVVCKPINHFHLVPTGHNVITAPDDKSTNIKSEHYGKIKQNEFFLDFIWSPYGLIIPASISRFPTYTKEFNPKEDTIITLGNKEVSNIYFEVSFIDKKVIKNNINVIKMPLNIINVTKNINELFNGISWFFLPLEHYSLIINIKSLESAVTPPSTIFIRWESVKNNLSHVSFLE